MGFGSGWGIPYGGGPIVPLDTASSEVGDADPITYDFSDAIDGPLPGPWEFANYRTAAGGAKSAEAEDDPTFYFRVSGGLGFWRYTRVPAIPGVGAACDERGYAASPAGILTGRNAEVGVAFVPPHLLVDGRQDEFQLEVIVGLRSAENGSQYVGGRTRAAWTPGGGWSPHVTVEAVQSTGSGPVILGSADLPTQNEKLDLWEANPVAELVATLRGADLEVSLNGIVARVNATVPDVGGVKPFVFVKVYNRKGPSIMPVPAVAAVRLRTLRDLTRLGAPPGIVGSPDIMTPELPLTRLPLRDLIDKKLLKRVSARAFEFIEETEVTVQGTGNRFLAGERVLAVEPYVGQEFTRITLDLGAIRGKSERG